MENKVFRAAVIGCGGIAQQHIAVLRETEGVRICAVCDVKGDRAEKAALETGAVPYTDAEKMLRDERPDAVHICTPHPLHAPMAEMAARMGIHVLTEKPPAAFREQWDGFEALKSAPGRVGVCFQNRFNGSVREMKRILGEEDTGKVLGARAAVYWYRDEDYYAGSDWRGSWESEGGGVLINQSIHTLDLLVWLLGKPALAGCTMANRHLAHVTEVEDTVEAQIDFGSARALFFATTAYCRNDPVEIDIVCENASLSMRGDVLTAERGGKRVTRDYSLAPLPGRDYWGTGHTACIRAFYDTLRTGEPFMNDIDSVRDTMRLMYDMYAPYRGKPMGKVEKRI